MKMVRFFLLDEMTCLSDLTGLWLCFTYFILLPLQKEKKIPGEEKNLKSETETENTAYHAA